MKKLLFLVIVVLCAVGCSVPRIALQGARLEVGEEHLELDLTIGNGGKPIKLLPMEFLIYDEYDNSQDALDYTEDLDEKIGQGAAESVTGTVFFPKFDVEGKMVKVAIVCVVLADEQNFLVVIEGTVKDGICDDFKFGRSVI